MAMDEKKSCHSMKYTLMCKKSANQSHMSYMVKSVAVHTDPKKKTAQFYCNFAKKKIIFLCCSNENGPLSRTICCAIESVGNFSVMLNHIRWSHTDTTIQLNDLDPGEYSIERRVASHFITFKCCAVYVALLFRTSHSVSVSKLVRGTKSMQECTFQLEMN